MRLLCRYSTKKTEREPSCDDSRRVGRPPDSLCSRTSVCLEEGVATELLNERETTGRAHPHTQKRSSSQTLIYET